MRSLTHFVPALALASALLPGCYQSDGRSGARDGGPRLTDAGRAVPVADSGLELDASVPRADAGLACPAVRADFACFESYALPVGRTSTIALSFDTCACCAETECAVAVDPASRSLRLTTTLCPDPCDCATCNTPVAACEIPALAAGTWRVEVNGETAFEVRAEEDAPGAIAEPPACIELADDDACTGAADILAAPLRRAARACARPVSDSTQRWEVELGDDCGGCERDSTCTVSATPRSTDDLPPGFDLTVENRGYWGACDGACPEICMPYTRTCALPPLPAGLHRLSVAGGPTLLFESGGPRETVCSD